jgi:hypothetical protein
VVSHTPNISGSPSTRERHRVALVRAGVTFEKGVMVERTDDKNEEVAA